MANISLKLMMVFLVAGPPALCKAGVLAQCCVATRVSVESESSCCERDCCESEAPTTPESPPMRSCGTCADVCAGVFKPGDDVNAPISLLSMLPAIVTAPTSIHLRHSVVDVDSTSLPDKLPFPISDVPLLI